MRRALQQAFDEAGCDDVRVLLASELRTHAWDAMKCANANHVLQKCIGTMRPMDSQFIIDELVHAGPGAVAKAARHRYGCRVLQRLYEHCAPDQMRPISEDLVKDALPLCRHIFAKYVMQHLIEHGSDEHVAALTQMLALHAPALGADGSACAVIGKALEHSGSMAQVNLCSRSCNSLLCLLRWHARAMVTWLPNLHCNFLMVSESVWHLPNLQTNITRSSRRPGMVVC